MDYPIWNVAIGGGMLMAVVAILHVIVSHFAIGGGLVIAVTETLAVRRDDHQLRELARRGSRMLILISTVFGAISGVGIWVVAGLIAPGAISALIHNYVWGWAIEWVLFFVEIIAALVYYMTWGKISKRAHLMVGWIYFVAAYLSLVVINGIVTFMLTPGRWLETHAFWDGFFNPTYWPSLMLRTGICALMATSFLLFAAQRSEPAARPGQLRYLGWWLLGGVVASYAGYRWWEASLPADVLQVFRGDSPLLPTLAATRSLTLWALTVALAVGALALVAVPRMGRHTVAVVVALAAFTFFGGFERLREGVRKPFLIRDYMYSNGLRVEEVDRINQQGLAAFSGWVARQSGEKAEVYGRQVFRTQCSSCHTLDGYQALRPLLPTTADMIALVSDDPPGSGERTFRSECASCHPDYSYDDIRDFLPGTEEIRKDPEFILQLNATMVEGTLVRLRAGEYPQMPPFVGSADDLSALAAYLSSLDPGQDARTNVARGGGE